jgi:hypothetical protein
MNTDNYDYEKSSLPQDLDGYTPFLDKQSNSYINDQNSGVYSANQSLVQFDLSSLYNSSKFTSTTDMFITLPIVMAVATSPLGTAIDTAPPTSAWALATLKSGYHNLIHQADIQVDGKTISETQPFLGTFTNIKLLSEMSQNDLISIGTTIGYSEVLDTPSSVIWNSAVLNTAATNGADLTNGNGLTNNNVFGSTTQTTLNGNQNVGVCNEAINKRALKVLDLSKAGQSKLTGAGNIYTNGAQIRDEFKSVYFVQNNIGYIFDLAVIRLKDIFDCMNNIGIVKRFNGVLRLYINTGSLFVTCNTQVTNDATTALPRYSFSPANSTFNNVCPFTINNLNTQGVIPFAQKQVCCGLFLAKTLPTSNNGVNLGATQVNHPMGSCRLYYSSIVLEPEKALTYSRANQAKNVVFKNYYFNQINTVGGGNTYSQLIQSGVTNPYALIVVPYIGSTAVGMNGMSQYQSPFDTAPATGAPIILDNLQVQLGGQQVLNSPYKYGFETFLTQFSNAEALSSSDFGISCGLVSKEWWEMNRIYYVNLSRGTKADQMTPRNIVLSFRNTADVPIDVQVFTVYLDRIVLNVDTGAVTR